MTELAGRMRVAGEGDRREVVVYLESRRKGSV